MAGNLQDALSKAGLAPALVSEDADAQSGGPAVDEPELSQVDAGIIEPGLVVLELDPVDLLEQPGVSCRGNPATRLGPFVCVGVAGGYSTWVGLTKAERIERLEIPVSWRLGGSERWRMGRQFLTDGATTYKGPNEAFAAASYREVFNRPEELPRISDLGLEAIIKRVEAARGRKKKNRYRRNRRAKRNGAVPPDQRPGATSSDD